MTWKAVKQVTGVAIIDMPSQIPLRRRLSNTTRVWTSSHATVDSRRMHNKSFRPLVHNQIIVEDTGAEAAVLHSQYQSVEVTLDPLAPPLAAIHQSLMEVGVNLVKEACPSLVGDASHHLGLVGISDKTNAFEQCDEILREPCNLSADRLWRGDKLRKDTKRIRQTYMK